MISPPIRELVIQLIYQANVKQCIRRAEREQDYAQAGDRHGANQAAILA